jgi:hypothetical protein
MNINAYDNSDQFRSKINLFIPCRLGGSKLIFFAPLGAGVNEENQ